MFASGWNPISYGNDSAVIEMIETIYGVSVSGTPVTAAISVPRVFTINVTNYGPESCLSINYGDGFNDTFGPDRSVRLIMFAPNSTSDLETILLSYCIKYGYSTANCVEYVTSFKI